jgi:hypothetical protein
MRICAWPLLQVSLQTAKSLKEDRAAEQCRDLRAVLNLLIHITQADLAAEEEPPARTNIAMVAPPGAAAAADGAAAAASAGDAGTSVIARVVLVGLNIVLPLINAGAVRCSTGVTAEQRSPAHSNTSHMPT